MVSQESQPVAPQGTPPVAPGPQDDIAFRAFRLLWWALSTGLFILSGRTVAAYLTGKPHSGIYSVVIAAIEMISAVLFLFPRTMKYGAIGLLFVLPGAFVAHALSGELRWDLFIYAFAVFYVKMRAQAWGLAK